jgi:glycosyltransferase involved in cell wall biosynthesis
LNEPVLILTYYWPPSGGSGVQRWMYFSKYLADNGFTPYVVTVDEKKASYKFIDNSFINHVKDIETVRTNTREVLKFYSRITTGKKNAGIPQAFAGETKPGLIKKFARYIRGNYFIPDARKGWNKFAYNAAIDLIKKHNIKKIITTGPPHSTHLIGLKLKEKFGVKWLADFRDPWREVFYNDLLYRSKRSNAIDEKLEAGVIEGANIVLTVGPGMAELLKRKTNSPEKVKFIYNGFDQDLFDGLKSVNFSTNEIVITHIGLLSDSQPIDSFLKALKNVLEKNSSTQLKVKLKLVGKVSEGILIKVNEIVPSITLEVIDYVSHKVAINFMVHSHILLNSLAEGDLSSYLISGKLMEYVASGRPIICLGDEKGDAAALLNRFDDCHVFNRNNVAAIEIQLSHLIDSFSKGKWCVHATEGLEFTRKKSTKELAELLKGL